MPTSNDGAHAYHSLDEIRVVERLAEHVAAASDARCYVSEETLDGPVFSVTTFSREGMHHIVGPVSQCGLDAPEPAPCAATEAELVLLRSLVRAALDVVGHEQGGARVAVALTGSGPRIAAIQLGDVSQEATGRRGRGTVRGSGNEAGTVREERPPG